MRNGNVGAISIRYTLSGKVLDSRLLQEDLVCTIATDHTKTAIIMSTLLS